MDIGRLIESIITLLVGAAVFIVGMNLMSSGLKKSTGKGVKSLFKKTQKNPFAGMGIGVATTALVQSSSTTSIMVIGFIATGAMTIYQGVSIILGAYIGTTVTGLIASLSSFPISTYFVLLAVIGVIMMFIKNEKVKNIGEIVTGLGLLFFGLSTMKSAINAETYPEMYDAVTATFNATSFPLLLLLIGAVFTSLVQSSSATAGITIVMVGSGAITLENGFYLMLGAGIGTIVPTLLAAIGGNAKVKRTAAICLFIRVITCTLAMGIIWPFTHSDGNYISDFFYNVFHSNELALAMFVLAYNLILMLAFVPFIKPIEKLFTKLIKDKDAEKQRESLKFIDEHLLKSPSLAMMQVKLEIIDMYRLAIENYRRGYNEMLYQKFENAKTLAETEDIIDYKNNAITDFLIKLSNKVTAEDEKLIGSYFHIINDIERIGDHAYNFLETSKQMNNDDLKFSNIAQEEFDQMDNVIQSMIKIVEESLENSVSVDVKELQRLEAETDKLKASLSSAHFNRVVAKTCRIELSPYYSTFISELERIGDHLMNIGYSFINPTGDEIINQ